MFIREACLQSLAGDFTNINHILQSADRETCLKTIDVLERERACCGSLQTKFANRVEQLTIEENREHGFNKRNLERGTASKVCLARRRAQSGGRTFQRCSRILVEDTPYLASRFAVGDLTLEQVLAITGPLEDLTAEQRKQFDQYYEQHPDMFDQLGCRNITDMVRKHTEKVEGSARSEKIVESNTCRYIRFRKGKDCIHLSGRLPLEEGLALQKHLKKQAAKAIQKGDTRTSAQLECDLLVRRCVTGTAEPLALRLELKLIMTDRSLFLGDREPAYLPGYGVIPAQYAREMVANAAQARQYEPSRRRRTEMQARIDSFPEIRRLFTAPGDQDLVAMDSKARAFPEALRDFIEIRDHNCRTPYCDNPASQADHIHQWWLGGPTSIDNGSYRCAHCNLAKELPGWAENLEQLLPHTMQIQPEPGTNYWSKSPPATGVAREMNSLIYPRDSWISTMSPKEEDPADPEKTDDQGQEPSEGD